MLTTPNPSTSSPPSSERTIPSSPTHSTTTFESSTSTMNAIANRSSSSDDDDQEETDRSSVGGGGEGGQVETNRERIKNQQPIAEIDQDNDNNEDEDGSKSIQGQSQKSLRTTRSSISSYSSKSIRSISNHIDQGEEEPTSPSNSTDPVINRSAVVAGHDEQIEVEEERERNGIERVKTSSTRGGRYDEGSSSPSRIHDSGQPTMTNSTSQSIKSNRNDPHGNDITSFSPPLPQLIQCPHPPTTTTTNNNSISAEDDDLDDVRKFSSLEGQENEGNEALNRDRNNFQRPVKGEGLNEEKENDPLAPPDGGLRAWLNVLGGFLVLFASFGYTNAFGVYQSYYSQTIYRDYSDSAISWIGSVQLCLFFVLALVAGPLFDKGKFRLLMIVGSIVQFATLFLIPQCREFWQTMLVQGVMGGIGIGLLFLPALSIQSHWFLRRRATAIGIVACGSSFGGIAFPIMLNKTFANPDVGFVDGVRASGYVVTACLVIANSIMSPHPARLIAKKPPLPPIRRILTPVYLFMTVGAFLLMWGLFFPLFYLQVYARSKGLSTDLSFYQLAIYNAGSVFGRTIPNLLADHLGPQNMQSFCTLGAGIVLYCMYACESPAAIITFAAVHGFLSGGFISLVSPAIISISDDISEIGLRQGLAFLIVAGGAVGGNPVCGRLLAVGENDFLAPIMFAATMATIGGIVTTVSRCLRAKEKGTWRV